MSLITTDEAKAYLRVDSSMDDSLIDSLLLSAEKICMDVARLTITEWTTLWDEETEAMTIRGTEILVAEILPIRSLLRTAMLYALGYLYEHREEADHHELVLTLRNILSSVREGVL